MSHDKTSKVKNLVRGRYAHILDFLDMIAPGIIKFDTDHSICGNTLQCVWAMRDYPSM